MVLNFIHSSSVAETFWLHLLCKTGLVDEEQLSEPR